MIPLKGTVIKNKLTKILIGKIGKGNIAVINHRSIDLVAAQDLKYRKVKAVINCDRTVDLKSNLEGVVYLLCNNIKIFDIENKDFFNYVHDGDTIEIDRYNNIFINNIYYTNCIPVSKYDLNKLAGKKNIGDIKLRHDFIKNTMSYMNSELNYFLYGKKLPEINTVIRGRDVIIISRGRNYREDLKSIKGYIKNRKPVIISVDGGANAVTDMGFRSDIVIGDMDSIDNKSLLNCSEILVHTYSNGYAPGLERIKAMKLEYKLLQLKGTSEDAAIYLAKLMGASYIYLIGSHLGVDEFIEKGRQGMGSTVLLRVLFGTRIVDLKGISNIYRYNKSKYNEAIVLSALLLAGFYILMTYHEAAAFLQSFIKSILH